MLMKNSNDTNGKPTCDLPACSAVPQPTAPPRGAPQTSSTEVSRCLWNKFNAIIFIDFIFSKFYSTVLQVLKGRNS